MRAYRPYYLCVRFADELGVWPFSTLGAVRTITSPPQLMPIEARGTSRGRHPPIYRSLSLYGSPVQEVCPNLRSAHSSLLACVLDSLAAGRGLHENTRVSPVAFYFLPSYRASLLLSFPSSMAMVLFFLVAVLMVVALVGLLLWFFLLRES